METIETLRDLEPHGIIPFTGEACDLTEAGYDLLCRVLGVRSIELCPPLSTQGNSVGSVMIPRAIVPALGALALRDKDLREIWEVIDRKTGSVSVVGVPDDYDNDPDYWQGIEEYREWLSRSAHIRIHKVPAVRKSSTL